MIVLASYLISVMIISIVLMGSNLSIELEAHHTCSRQVLAFVKNAQVRVINIQFPCCNRDTTSMMVPLGKTQYGSKIRPCIARKVHSQGR